MEAMTRSLAARVREGLAASGIDAARDPRAVRALIHRAIDRYAPDLLPSAREQVEADLMDDICGLGPLQALMDDPSVEEIWINAASRVFVARSGVAELTSLILTDEDVRALVERMLHHSGRRLDLSSPFVDAMLAGGERLHVVIPPVTGSSWSVNIRKHIQRARTLEDLVAVEMIAPPMRDFLAASVSCGLSVLVSGGTQAGKTTLLRLLSGIEKPDSGRVVPGHGLKLGYYAQEHETLDDTRTIRENMAEAAPTLDDTHVRNILGQFLFQGDDVDKPVSVLSGGEKTRLALATRVVSGANVLLLDEPTNNLDPASREEILAALRDYEGAVILVTHDPGAVTALNPQRVLLLPDADEDLWDDSYLDLVTLT